MHFDQVTFNRVVGHAAKWAAENQWAVGLAEMALGTAAIHWSLQSGLIEMGTHLVGSASPLNPAAALGGFAGMSLGAVAIGVIGSIGVVGMGGAIAIPAALLTVGGSLVFAATGYAITDIVSRYLTSFNFGDLAGAGTAFAVGVALLIDGARRSVEDEKVRRGAAYLINGAVRLSTVGRPIVATTMDELQDWLRSVGAAPTSVPDAAGNLGLAVLAGAGGVAIGSSIAASSVTVFGSPALGAAALSLGLVSAPVWPVVAGCAGGACAGYAAWKTAKHLMGRHPNLRSRST